MIVTHVRTCMCACRRGNTSKPHKARPSLTHQGVSRNYYCYTVSSKLFLRLWYVTFLCFMLYYVCYIVVSKTLVQVFISFLPPGLLQLAVLRHLWRTDQPAAVGSERHRPSGYWHPTLRPHIAGAPSATLATGMPARRLQGGHTRTPVAVWHFTTVPGWRLPSCRRCSWAATTFHGEPNMHSDLDIQHLLRQSVRSCWPRTMEQSSVAPERRLTYRTVNFGGR